MEKSVQFNMEENQTKVMYVHDYAMRRSRIGDEWQRAAIDSIRFKDRIRRIDSAINDIFCETHRNKIYKERFMTQNVGNL